MFNETYRSRRSILQQPSDEWAIIWFISFSQSAFETCNLLDEEAALRKWQSNAQIPFVSSNKTSFWGDVIYEELLLIQRYKLSCSSLALSEIVRHLLLLVLVHVRHFSIFCGLLLCTEQRIIGLNIFVIKGVGKFIEIYRHLFYSTTGVTNKFLSVNSFWKY